MELTETVIGTEEIYNGRVVHLRIDTIRQPDGFESKREIVAHPGAHRARKPEMSVCGEFAKSPPRTTRSGRCAATRRLSAAASGSPKKFP